MTPKPEQSLMKVCVQATGLTINEVVKIAALGPKRYKVYDIPKRSGGHRTICHPSRELKVLQHVFSKIILTSLPVHAAATGYKAGSSIKANAAIHLHSRVILKIDFVDFFHSITVNDWNGYVKDNLPTWSAGEIDFSAYVMFWGEGRRVPRCLSIGAPTSPLVSNLLLYQFDVAIAAYAKKNGLAYTRYADDLTFSSVDFLDKDATLQAVQMALNAIKYPRLSINAAKTRLASKSTSRRVTGIVLANNASLSLGRDRKRLISSMVHRVLVGEADLAHLNQLNGWLSFAKDVEPTFIDALRRKYGVHVVEMLRSKARDPA